MIIFSSGVFLDCGKKSFSTPIFKLNDKNNIRNYRSISSLSVMPKIFEALITTKLVILLTNLIIKQYLSKHRSYYHLKKVSKLIFYI